MSVYHQMGHDTQNLLHVDELDNFSGAILSPVNETENEIFGQIASLQERQSFETIFDPQLYYPRSDRGFLRDWSYFPEDVDTADLTSESWWQNIANELASVCDRIRPNAVCSPAFTPILFSNEYYSEMVRLGNYFDPLVSRNGIRPIQTVIASLAELSSPLRAFEIASIISRTHIDTVYLVLVGTTPPRRELNNPEEIKGAMRLISSLERSGMRVIVGYSSTDFILWKAAGAAICSTGKFFNLRRFTSSRFEEPPEGGGQLPYWFEEALIAFLRESDVIRVRDQGSLSDASHQNPFAQQILNILDTEPERAWLALSWRQYMYGFAALEARIEAGVVDISELLRSTERTWLELEDSSVLMEEPRNNGEWIRAWRRALVEYRR